MALKARPAQGATPYSSNGSFSTPLLFESPSGFVEHRVYLDMDDPDTQWASSITIYAKDVSGTDDSSSIQIAPDVGGAPGTYASSLLISLLDLNDSAYFWVKANVPSGLASDKIDLRLVLQYSYHTI